VKEFTDCAAFGEKCLTDWKKRYDDRYDEEVDGPFYEADALELKFAQLKECGSSLIQDDGGTWLVFWADFSSSRTLLNRTIAGLKPGCVGSNHIPLQCHCAYLTYWSAMNSAETLKDR
jgi:hypothetical protein